MIVSAVFTQLYILIDATYDMAEVAIAFRDFSFYVRQKNQDSC